MWRYRPRAVLLLALLFLEGCGGSRHEVATAQPPLQHTEGPGLTTFTLKNSLHRPYVLDRWLLVLDGELISRDRVPVGRSKQVAARQLDVGVHSISLSAVSSFPQGLAGPRCRVILRTLEQFRVGDAPGVVEIELYLKRPSAGFVERIDMRTNFSGVESAQRELPSPPDFTACAGLEFIETTMCRIRAVTAPAREARDLVFLTCLSEKLELLQHLAERLDRSTTRLAEPELPDDDRNYQLQLTAALEARISSLSQEAENCVDHPPWAPGPPRSFPIWEVEGGEACFGEEELWEEDRWEEELTP